VDDQNIKQPITETSSYSIISC